MSSKAKSFFPVVYWGHVVGWPQHLDLPRGMSGKEYEQIQCQKRRHPEWLVGLVRCKEHKSLEFIGGDAVVVSELLEAKLSSSAAECAPVPFHFCLYAVTVSALATSNCAEGVILEDCRTLHCSVVSSLLLPRYPPTSIMRHVLGYGGTQHTCMRQALWTCKALCHFVRQTYIRCVSSGLPLPGFCRKKVAPRKGCPVYSVPNSKIQAAVEELCTQNQLEVLLVDHMQAGYAPILQLCTPHQPLVRMGLSDTRQSGDRGDGEDLAACPAPPPPPPVCMCTCILQSQQKT